MSTSMTGLALYARNAGADLSAKVFYLAKVDTDGDIILATSGAHGIGVIVEANVENKPVTVQCDGIAKVILGAQTSAGVRVGADSNGKAVAATHGEFEFGTLLTGGNSGDIVTMLLQPGRAAA
jgi:hypothetical protein